MSVERLERSLTTMWRGIMQHLLGRSALRVRHRERKRCGQASPALPSCQWAGIGIVERCSALKFLGRGSVWNLGRGSVWKKATARGRLARNGATCFLLRLVELLPACSGCDAGLSGLVKSAARKPASIGRLRAGRLETRVNSGLADRQPGNARKHWASGQPLRKSPFYAGFRVGVVADIVAGLS